MVVTFTTNFVCKLFIANVTKGLHMEVEFFVVEKEIFGWTIHVTKCAPPKTSNTPNAFLSWALFEFEIFCEVVKPGHGGIFFKADKLLWFGILQFAFWLLRLLSFCLIDGSNFSTNYSLGRYLKGCEVVIVFMLRYL